MKYLMQFGVIAVISFIAEIMYIVIPLPVPASVYGLVLLFVLLMAKVVKIEQVEDCADFFMTIMPILFISPCVSLLASFDIMKGNILILIVMIAVSTTAVMGVTALISQAVIKCRKRKEGSNE